MHRIYDFISGPLVWAAFGVFILGCVYRVVQLLWLVNKKEKFIFSYMSVKYSLRSTLHWLVPLGTQGWKANPVLTIITFVFHISLFIVPIFLLSHITLVDEAWNMRWAALPDPAADVLTLVIILCCVFFLIRRLIAAEVKFVTSISDYVLLSVVAAPFITGFIAYHQWIAYQWFFILHILSGEIMLMAIPFTRLSHMVIAPFTRAYMGSEFGAVRMTKDW
jgi:nitrate reductase gamma subunit